VADLARLTRNAVKVLPEGELERKLALGRPLRVKLGIDPTARDIHIGQAIPLQRMRAFQDQGHTGILIVGDYTARVGDPSGRSKERRVLSDEEIDANAKRYFSQALRILDGDRTELRFNSEWLGTLDFGEILRLTRTITVSRLLERNDFERRFKAEQPISVSEFLYPLMQAYDSVAIQADIELGGTDQEYNLLTGRDVQLAYGQEPQVILTTPLINGPNGVDKMSASLGNYISIDEPPAEMFGKAMSCVDELMHDYYRLCLEADGPPPADPYTAKREFARRLVERWHGAEAAAAAEAGFDRMFKDKRATDDAPVLELPDGDPVHVPALLADHGLAASRGEARRLISQGGVRLDGEPLEASELDVPRARVAGAELRVGRRFARVAG
jgi:tyrosyl-tRNA synthetase